MSASKDKIKPCQKCGRVPYILSSRARLHNLGIRPMRCTGCDDLLPPYIPESTRIVRVSTNGLTIAQGIAELFTHQKCEPAGASHPLKYSINP